MEPHPNRRPAETLPAELRAPTLPAGVQAWLSDVERRAVVGVEVLDGASSAAVFRVEFSTGAPVVVRRYVWTQYLHAEPDAPRREVDALLHAGAAGLPVPRVLHADPYGDAGAGDGVPLVVMTLLAGRPTASPDPGRTADVAARVHAVDPGAFAPVFQPWCQDPRPDPPPTATRPEAWAEAIDRWIDGPPRFVPAFIHRDFHPGNLLWDGETCGIVDWANACIGPVDVDVAHCRANLRRWAGPAAAERFVDAYAARTGHRLDPFWIMAGHLEHDASHWTPAQVAADEDDLLAALAALDG